MTHDPDANVFAYYPMYTTSPDQPPIPVIELRDYLAMHAPFGGNIHDVLLPDECELGTPSMEGYARFRYRLADAYLKARQASDPPAKEQVA